MIIVPFKHGNCTFLDLKNMEIVLLNMEIVLF